MDDALIAEWVDGAVDEDSPRYQAIAAHVAECDDCRTRVEEERALADHVRQLLGAAAPPERVPPFDEVLHRANRRRTGLPPVWRRLAWAATVVVAGGVGWYARGALLEGDGRGPRPAASVPVARGAAPAEATVPMAAAGEAPAQETAPAGDAGAPAPTRADAAMEAERATEVTAADAVSNERRQAATAEAAREGAPAPTPRPEPAARLMQAAPLAAPVVAEKSEIETWTTVTGEVAATTLGRAPLTVPGLRVVRFARSADGIAIRITQDLGDGRLLQLIESAAALPASPGRVAPVDEPEVGRGSALAVETVSRDGIGITGMAPVPADSLRILLAKLR
ncbi:MAG: hypothetical protein VKI81_11775 [Synechococcaceae cyanobacterium]|nr:hypothetical protein [Synechococcaceae cyanobacterium]